VQLGALSVAVAAQSVTAAGGATVINLATLVTVATVRVAHARAGSTLVDWVVTDAAVHSWAIADAAAGVWAMVESAYVWATGDNSRE